MIARHAYRRWRAQAMGLQQDAQVAHPDGLVIPGKWLRFGVVLVGYSIGNVASVLVLDHWFGPTVFGPVGFGFGCALSYAFGRLHGGIE